MSLMGQGKYQRTESGVIRVGTTTGGGVGSVLRWQGSPLRAAPVTHEH